MLGITTGESPEVITPNQAGQSLVIVGKKPTRIPLVDAALVLQESHLLLFRSVPASVEPLLEIRFK
jgi:hypothetical protein